MNDASANCKTFIMPVPARVLDRCFSSSPHMMMTSRKARACKAALSVRFRSTTRTSAACARRSTHRVRASSSMRQRSVRCSSARRRVSTAARHSTALASTLAFAAPTVANLASRALAAKEAATTATSPKDLGTTRCLSSSPQSLPPLSLPSAPARTSLLGLSAPVFTQAVTTGEAGGVLSIAFGTGRCKLVHRPARRASRQPGAAATEDNAEAL
mmetsp:Transcript_149491/g.372157  ORF Transcript_149491/g.372157 Transcript_149491/m.372157 type:complete len:214 (+) Transcript_149491:91-732(+)